MSGSNPGWDDLAERIAAIPFLDHHVHQPYREPLQITVEELRRPFTEAMIPAVWRERLPNQLGYRWMVRQLARRLGVQPREAAILEVRNGMEPPAWHRWLADDANLGECLADDLLDQDRCYTADEWSALLGGRPVRRLLRIEAFIEQHLLDAATLDDALGLLRQAIAGADGQGVAGLKSIIGYRVGLAVEQPTAGAIRQAETEYAALRRLALAGERTRLASKALADLVLWTALEAAAPQRLPIQFHVAFGDDDIVMTQNDPTLLRAIYRHEPFREIPLVLLHCYPYHRQAGYLASIYPNVYVDLGLTIPIVGPGAERVLAETLELAPAGQVLASSDGHIQPEFQWFGIVVWRWALERVSRRLIEHGVIDAAEALTMAEAILRNNSQAIYPLSRARTG